MSEKRFVDNGKGSELDVAQDHQASHSEQITRSTMSNHGWEIRSFQARPSELSHASVPLADECCHFLPSNTVPHANAMERTGNSMQAPLYIHVGHVYFNFYTSLQVQVAAASTRIRLTIFAHIPPQLFFIC